MPILEREARAARLRRTVRLALPYVLSAAFLLLGAWLSTRAQADPDFAEAVAQTVYRPFSNVLSRITGGIPFSLLEFGLIAVVLLLFVLLFRFIRKLVKEKGKRAAICCRWLTGALCVFSSVFLVFTLLCGVNYYRRPFSYYSGLTVQPSSTDELESLCRRLAEEANALRPLLAEDEAGTTLVFTQGYGAAADEARAAMVRLAERYPVLEGNYPRTKAVTFSTMMSRIDLTGVYFPFTMEANVNVACPQYSIPATMCHELSHLRGFMREDEANFIAYLACMVSDDASFRYSAVTLALIHAGNQLYAADLERFRALTATYGEGLRRDLTANSAYWQQYSQSWLSTMSTKVNDTYLRANNQTDGVQSYGRMVDLLLALYRQTGDIALSAEAT